MSDLKWTISKGTVAESGAYAGQRLLPATAGYTKTQVVFDAPGRLDQAAQVRVVAAVQSAARDAADCRERRDLDAARDAVAEAEVRLSELQADLDEWQTRWNDGKNWNGPDAAHVIAALKKEGEDRAALCDAQKLVRDRLENQARAARGRFDEAAGKVAHRLIAGVRDLLARQRRESLEALEQAVRGVLDQVVVADHALAMLQQPDRLTDIILMEMSACVLPEPPPPPPPPPAPVVKQVVRPKSRPVKPAEESTAPAAESTAEAMTSATA